MEGQVLQLKFAVRDGGTYYNERTRRGRRSESK
jgi:hypothetical protein